MEVNVNRLTRRIAFLATLSLVPVADALACSPQSLMGSICVTAGNRCPKDTLPADGQLLAIADHAPLFSLLGTTFGGNGRTTFALPDLRGRVAVNRGQGRGLSDREIGQQLGSLQLPLTVDNLPPHDHPASSTADVAITLRGQSRPGDSAEPSGKSFAALRNAYSGMPTTTYGYSNLPADVDMDASAIKVRATVTTTLEPAGGGKPATFGNAQPTLVMTVCIVTEGTFPNYQ